MITLEAAYLVTAIITAIKSAKIAKKRLVIVAITNNSPMIAEIISIILIIRKALSGEWISLVVMGHIRMCSAL